MQNKMREYTKSSSLYEERNKCTEKFYISEKTNLKIDKLYNAYFMYDYKMNNNKTIIEEFTNENRLILNKSQRNVLSSMIKSNFSIFKIEDINSTKAIIKDYFTDKKIIVEDVDLAKKVKNNDSIITRIVNIQGMNILVQEYIKVSKSNIKIILENINKLHKNNKTIKSLKEFINCNSEIIYYFAQQIILHDESYVVTQVNLEKVKSKENKKEDDNLNIYNILKDNMEDKYLQKGIDLWDEFKKSNKSIKGSENGWAAAIEYYIKKAAGETVTQVQVSEKYEVSPSTLGKRYKALRVS